MKMLRDRQQQELADEMKQSGRRSPDGASNTIAMQIKLGIAQAEQLLSQDTLTYAPDYVNFVLHHFCQRLIVVV